MDEGLAPLPDHQGRTLAGWLSLTLFVVWPLLPQVVKISDLKGLVLGQEFSIEWKLPVSDLEKFNCYPEGAAVSEERCRLRGCLWEVIISEQITTVSRSWKNCPMNN